MYLVVSLVNYIRSKTRVSLGNLIIIIKLSDTKSQKQLLW